jgi:hypothetical protein
MFALSTSEYNRTESESVYIITEEDKIILLKNQQNKRLKIENELNKIPIDKQINLIIFMKSDPTSEYIEQSIEIKIEKITERDKYIRSGRKYTYYIPNYDMCNYPEVWNNFNHTPFYQYCLECDNIMEYYIYQHDLLLCKLCKNIKKCSLCLKNILDTNFIKDIYRQLMIASEYIYFNCVNILYLLKNITYNNIDIRIKNIPEDIFNKIKQQQYNKENIDAILYSKCFLCNKKKFKSKLNKYTYDNYILYLKNIKILEIKSSIFYKHYGINNKTYAYLCNNCNNRITKHTFYNKFFFDNLEKQKLSEKQIDILNKIKQFCIE